jgi:hypothetical protein
MMYMLFGLNYLIINRLQILLTNFACFIKRFIKIKNKK